MLPKQTNYNVGVYMRLSKDDERNGESLSIENQRKMLTDYVSEQGWTIYDEYVDDGISGVSFDRPGVQRMLDDAKAGKINLIICKDLSRFGRNYIQVGQYTDYIFPMYNIRFIALTDNVDTANSQSAGMDMMPIMNIFNEWHSANTSKKLRAVHASGAKAGKYYATYCAFGYLKSDDGKRTPVIDPYAAPIVRRIFEMRASGYGMKQIADVLNDEHIPTPMDYQYKRIGKTDPHEYTHIWGAYSVKLILNNPIYIGTLAQHRSTSVSYKNHKRVFYDPSEWIVVENNHEPIITQELWDKVREIEASVSRGKRNKKGDLAPLSGLLYCDSCGYKMKQEYTGGNGYKKYSTYVCGFHSRYGKDYCSTHRIYTSVLTELVVSDIRAKLQLIVDEDKARKQFLEKKSGLHNAQTASDKKRKHEAEKRLAELETLIQSVYENMVLGKVAEDVCIGLLGKYQAEKKNLQTELDTIQKSLDTIAQDENDVDEFIRRLKKYAGFEVLTREMALDLIEYITVDECVPRSAEPRTIHIYYKFLDKPLKNKKNALK
ncbi:MAG: recombinase family protein [Ruminococcus sp.]|nr:recombinase family protein [Ruminococcus sp.]